MISYNNTYSLSNSNSNLEAFKNFSYNYEKNYNNKIREYKSKNYNIESNINNCIEYINDINDINHDVHYEEITYKIFDDLTHIIKNKNNIELIINIPNTYELLSIIKIRLSKKITKYIKDIYVKQNKEIILSKDKLLNINTKDINNVINNSQGELNLYIIIESNSLNHIINSNIYILFLFINRKNKVKFLNLI
jgi:hypothetical protein